MTLINCIFRMSNLIHNQEVPLGDNFDQAQGAGDEASHVVPNPLSIGSQVPLSTVSDHKLSR